MKRTFIIDYANNLMQVGGVTKRLPIKQCCDCEFAFFAWDGSLNRGVVSFVNRLELIIANDSPAKAFADMFDLEPPQLFPEQIGARPQMDGPDEEWNDLLARHGGTVVELRAVIETAIQAVEDENAAKQMAADAKAAAFQQQMNDVRRAKGIPEVDYAARA